jgi:hypothetical protein
VHSHATTGHLGERARGGRLPAPPSGSTARMGRALADARRGTPPTYARSPRPTQIRWSPGCTTPSTPRRAPGSTLPPRPRWGPAGRAHPRRRAPDGAPMTEKVTGDTVGGAPPRRERHRPRVHRRGGGGAGTVNRAFRKSRSSGSHGRSRQTPVTTRLTEVGAVPGAARPAGQRGARGVAWRARQRREVQVGAGTAAAGGPRPWARRALGTDVRTPRAAVRAGRTQPPAGGPPPVTFPLRRAEFPQPGAP